MGGAVRPSKVDSGTALAAIRNVFREHGFDGASLTRLADATGLRRASLYHRYPGGKDDMAEAAIDSVAVFLERDVFANLANGAPWPDRLRVFCEQLDAYYDSGRTLCLLAAFSFGSVPKAVRQKARRIASQWRGHLASLVVEAGCSEERAQAIAEQILVEVQGGLIVAALMNNPSSFRAVLDRLPALVLDASNQTETAT